MNRNVWKLVVLLSSILVFFTLRCFAADQQTVFVVAQDKSQIFYHQNGTPIDSEDVPKGIELTIESTSGERCFVTYKGKPAYIRRQLLATKQEFLEAQQKATQQQVVPPAESSTSTQQQVAATLTANAVTKDDARADAIHSVIQNLKLRADTAIDSGHYHFIGAMFTSYGRADLAARCDTAPTRVIRKLVPAEFPRAASRRGTSPAWEAMIGAVECRRLVTMSLEYTKSVTSDETKNRTTRKIGVNEFLRSMGSFSSVMKCATD